MKEKLSWKILLPVGFFLWFFDGIIRLIGVIMFLMGLVDLFRKKTK